MRAGFGQTEEAHLALLDQVLDGSGNIFHRHFGIHAMLVENIDVIGPEPLEASFDGSFDMIGFAVDAAVVHARVRIDVPAKFGRDLDSVPDRS